jgi:hypothetical protein
MDRAATDMYSEVRNRNMCGDHDMDMDRVKDRLFVTINTIDIP